MISVTDTAKVKIREVLGDRSETACIRVFVAGMGCGGPNWKLAAEPETSDYDEVIPMEGFRVVADKEIISQFGELNIDYSSSSYGAGFRVTSSKKLGKTCHNGRCSC